MDWRARLDRIWAERAALDVLAAILPPGTVPEVLFEDRPNYLFAMTCAPDDSATWKTHLMAGQADPGIAARLGTILGTIHADAPGHRCSARDPGRHLAVRRAADRPLLPHDRPRPSRHRPADRGPDRLDGSALSERTLVLGDFSPKNILVHSGGLILLDFECAHAATPRSTSASSSATCCSRRSTWAGTLTGSTTAIHGTDARVLGRLPGADRGRASWRTDGLVPRAIEHTAACLLARVDGKSPVEYLDRGRPGLGPGAGPRSALKTRREPGIDDAPARWKGMNS